MQRQLRRIASDGYGLHHMTFQLCYSVADCTENHPPATWRRRQGRYLDRAGVEFIVPGHWLPLRCRCCSGFGSFDPIDAEICLRNWNAWDRASFFSTLLTPTPAMP